MEARKQAPAGLNMVAMLSWCVTRPVCAIQSTWCLEFRLLVPPRRSGYRKSGEARRQRHELGLI
jgi:hypothetical protein